MLTLFIHSFFPCFSLSNITFIQSFTSSSSSISWYTVVQYFHFQEPVAVHNRNPFITRHSLSSLPVADSSPVPFSRPFTMSLFTITNHFLLSSHLPHPFPTSSLARTVSHHIPLLHCYLFMWNKSCSSFFFSFHTYTVIPTVGSLWNSRILAILLPVEESTVRTSEAQPTSGYCCRLLLQHLIQWDSFKSCCKGLSNMQGQFYVSAKYSCEFLIFHSVISCMSHILV